MTGRHGRSRTRGLVGAAVGIVAVVALVVALQLWPRAEDGPPPDPTTASPSDEDQPVDRTQTLPPGAPLPDGADCAGQIARDGWEPRPENETANHTVPPEDFSVPLWQYDGYEPELNEIVIPRIDGQFRGTTDEIIRWGACKWGFETDVIRAMATEESSWRQSTSDDFSDDPADCVGGATTPCATSFGLLQVRHTFRPGSYPYSATSTAFNVDYALGIVRACYEGWVSYLDNGYGPGDLWGCLGWHFSGNWRDSLALGYIERVQRHLATEPWSRW